MSEQQRKLKTWQGWALFGGAMLIVFCLGLLAASLMERRAEVASIFNNRRFPMKDSIVSLNDSFAVDFPREYETWKMTADTIRLKVSLMGVSERTSWLNAPIW